MSALDLKLFRDLWRLKGQVISIALVVASGVALLVMSLSTYDALRISADTYYERYRFGHVFSSVKRAPLHLIDRISSLDGVQNVQLRISKHAILDVKDFPEPLMGRLMSVPEGRQPLINRLVLKSGRLVSSERRDEVVINDSFAKEHGLVPGDTIAAIINNKKRELRVVGTAMSPEFIYVIAPFALIPDKKRYGILWMGRQSLEAAYDYKGAFNDVSLTVLRGTDTKQTVQRLDNLLARYGGVGGVDREDHLSSWFVENELRQNRTLATILPSIFLVVAAFLTHTVLTRLISTERSEIGLMKAYGYSNAEVGWHYMKFVIVITAFGILLGWWLGAVLGRISTNNYADVLHFPLLIYQPGPASFAIGAVVSLGVGLLATSRAVMGAVRMPPSVAMRPPEPPVFKRDRGALRMISPWLDETTRIIVRQIIRWPGRAIITTLGFSAAIAMMVLSLQFVDSVDEILGTHFDEFQREDIALGFSDPKSSIVLEDIGRLPGIMTVEPMRIVPADLVAGHRVHRGTLQGLSQGARLTKIYDVREGEVPVPLSGVVINKHLAEKLSVVAGDEISVHVLEGRRPVRRVKVADVFESYVGMFAFMDIKELNRMMSDRPVTGYVSAMYDPSLESSLLTKLKNLPAVSTVSLRSVAISNFNETIGKTLMVFVGFFVSFSFALGFGVTYNSQRISLSERGRELATLRVLGFSRQDTLYILLGETMLLVFLALPLGCLFGWLLTGLFVNASGFQTELVRLPLIIMPSTYGLAVVVLLIACVVSGVAMKRRVDELDLISVLKTRE